MEVTENFPNKKVYSQNIAFVLDSAGAISVESSDKMTAMMSLVSVHCQLLTQHDSEAPQTSTSKKKYCQVWTFYLAASSKHFCILNVNLAVLSVTSSPLLWILFCRFKILWCNATSMAPVSFVLYIFKPCRVWKLQLLFMNQKEFHEMCSYNSLHSIDIFRFTWWNWQL